MRNILCIDLKSFYASCECLLINKDPFTYPMVVASKTQGPGAITLAITPYMKSLGINSRSRLFEIPSNIKYDIIEPKMSYYAKMSKSVISIYLDFVAKEDLHVYSIDEAFLDVTNYLSYYKMSDLDLGKKILSTIHEKTGLYATCGIGENMFIAKTAMDIESKKQPDFIAKWSLLDAKENLKKISKLTDMWGIGNNMARNLKNLGIYSVKDLQNSDKFFLISKLGIIGEELWNHANGLDDAIISEKNFYSKNVSYGSSQILFKDYNNVNVLIVIKETIHILTKRLRDNNKSCSKISLGITYSNNIQKNFLKSFTMDHYTRDNDVLFDVCEKIFLKYIEDFPIRKISISLGNILNNNYVQGSLFYDTSEILKKESINKVSDFLNDKYGKSTVMRASYLLEDSTIISRNKKIAGHHE